MLIDYSLAFQSHFPDIKNVITFYFLFNQVNSLERLYSEKAAVSLPPTTETVQLSAINAEASGQVMGESVAAEEGATIVQAEDGKQLVSIGDGQYVELPEGYTLIQTDEGYIIGQPGATFVQVGLNLNSL